MRQFLKTTAIISGLTLSLGSTAAWAGNCGFGASGPNCTPNVVVHPSGGSQVDPMHVYASRPMGHLRSIQYLGTPSVNITRIHGQNNIASVSDAPSGFTGGCTPESTQYCRQGGSVSSAIPVPMTAGLPAPMPVPVTAGLPAPMPVPMTAGLHSPFPLETPVIAPPAPVIAAPAPAAERVIHVGGGYDPSKFVPRTYGTNELTPGIAHIPTSHIDRSFENAQAVLNSGMTQAQPIVSGGTVPHPTMSNSAMAAISYGSVPSFTGSAMGTGYMGAVNQTVTMAPETNVYPGSMSNDGTYWENVSGPTTMNGLSATQVICKREAPKMNVQRPVIGVPTPVPTAVTPSCVNAATGAPVKYSGRYGY